MQTAIKRYVSFEELRAAIAESIGIDPGEITLQTNFIRDLGVDSLSLAQLMLDLEQDLGCEITDDDAAKLFTPQDVLNYLQWSV